MSAKARGIKFERRVRAYLVKKGYEARRVRASLGSYDLVAIKKDTKEILFIQTKYGKKVYINASKKQYEEMTWMNTQFQGRFIFVGLERGEKIDFLENPSDKFDESEDCKENN